MSTNAANVKEMIKEDAFYSAPFSVRFFCPSVTMSEIQVIARFTGVWNPSDSINEPSWRKFVNATVELESQRIPLSAVKNYLKSCNKNAQQPTYPWLTSGYVPSIPGLQTWNRVFDILSCSRNYNKNQRNEIYVNLELLRSFFENPLATLKKVNEEGALVAKKVTGVQKYIEPRMLK